MKKQFCSACALLLLLAIPTAAFAVDFTVQHRESVINWTGCYISAKGKASIDVGLSGNPVDSYDGLPVSINRARTDTRVMAKDDAVENLIRAFKLLQVDTGTRLADLLKHDFTSKRMAEALNESLKVRNRPLDFHTTECEVRLSLGDIISIVPYDFPGNDFPVIDDTPLRTDYSSLIIDGRGLNLAPMLFPSIFNEDGLEIYGRIFVDGRYASKYGLASYCYNEDDARKSARAGARPFYAVALKNNGGCPVLSYKDARKILSAPATRNNLKKCRVIFILDREKKM